ncbi:MAG: glycosyltransferase [Pseudopelagicola sp.]|nr:glycosyltransferase [Pseudopelagicola sp.]
MFPENVKPEHKNALIYNVDENVLPSALYSASKAASLNPDRDFDILLCSLSALDIPKPLRDQGITPVHLDLSDEMAPHGFKVGYLPLTTYLRLWLPKTFGDIYERILYIDTDTAVTDTSLSDFTKIDLGPHAIAGVRDLQQWMNIDKPLFEFKNRNMGGGAYLNGGVLLMDTDAFNRRGLLDRILETNRTMGPFHHHDQSLINLTLRHEWAELHPHWNWQGARPYQRLTQTSKPRVLHFVGTAKPYRTDGRQLVFPHDLVADYARFYAEHFPELERPEPPRNHLSDRLRQTFKHRAIGAATRPFMRPLFRRFTSDTQALFD